MDKLKKILLLFLFFLPCFSHAYDTFLPGYNASIIRPEENALGYFASGSLIYMQAIEDNLTYAVSSADSNRLNPPLDGIKLTPKFSWHTGVKAGFGFFFPSSAWNFNLGWMRLIAKNNADSTAPAGGALFMPESVVVGGSSICQKASGDWGLTFNQWNVTLSRESLNSPFIIFNYYWGLSAIWIEQSFRVQYDQITNQSGGQGNTRAQSNFDNRGIGPLLGFDSTYEIGEGFRIFGQAGASILYNWFNTKKRIDNPNLAASLGLSPSSSIAKLKESLSLLKPNAELALGFGWGSPVHNKSWYLDFSIDYEIHHFWGQNSHFIFTDSLSRGTFVQGGDLDIHGANFTVRFDF